MATRLLLTDLVQAWQDRGGEPVQIASVGGVDAAKRVAAGEAFDLVILASEAIDRLIASGHALPGSRVDLVHSGVAVAVRSGAPLPELSSEAALRAAVLAAPSLSYSTGPSGVALAALFERWGVMDTLRERIVTPPPGVPVGTLVASGQVALGFQQLSELIHVSGITIAGPLPDAVQIDTIFAGAVCATCTQPTAVRNLLAFMASPVAAEAKQRQGMTPA
ncbi:substrate-binding domain-containing protein [Ideonella sp. 4Y11]|uniref:Substrate-binding domain-containing protein n=1 Tax=Ideonella aquatica TaxID=2824119 RepID=A0A941BPX5_9BURK|nr:substrate-binding domain-containing protein [Ideonella aquatica]MBQ0958515.1 substrate-binding domain-containing protein [Ideonella aquatica]